MVLKGVRSSKGSVWVLTYFELIPSWGQYAGQLLPEATFPIGKEWEYKFTQYTEVIYGVIQREPSLYSTEGPGVNWANNSYWSVIYLLSSPRADPRGISTCSRFFRLLLIQTNKTENKTGLECNEEDLRWISRNEKGNWTPANSPFQFPQDGEFESTEHDENIDGDEKNLRRERIVKKLKKEPSANVKSAGEGEVEKKSVSRR